MQVHGGLAPRTLLPAEPGGAFSEVDSTQNKPGQQELYFPLLTILL